MKSIKLVLIAIAITFIGISACKKSDRAKDALPIENLQTLSDLVGNKTLKNFSGTVVDVNNKPLENVSITIGDKSILTDSLGCFNINESSVLPDFASILAKKDGYQFRSLNLNSDHSKNRIIIELRTLNDICLFWFCQHNHSLPNFEN